MGQTVYLIDDLLAAPGKGRELLAAYRERYVPGGVARGMTLEKVIVSPPVWLEEASNRLTILWTVEGPGGWWGQAAQSRYDPAVAQFWASIQDLVVSRRRHFGAADADVAELADA
jgi:hypothetical protein